MTTETMENGTDITTIYTYVTTKETWDESKRQRNIKTIKDNKE